MKHILWILLCGVLALSGCATMSSPAVSVVRSAPPGSVPSGAALMVVAEPGEVDWSAEQALRATGQQVASSSPWRLRVSERVILRAQPSFGMDCRYPWMWSGRPYYGGFGAWPYDPWCDRGATVTARRTITWILEDERGRVWWQASSRERQMEAPPHRASSFLAQALAAWRAGLVSNP